MAGLGGVKPRHLHPARLPVPRPWFPRLEGKELGREGGWVGQPEGGHWVQAAGRQPPDTSCKPGRGERKPRVPKPSQGWNYVAEAPDLCSPASHLLYPETLSWTQPPQDPLHSSGPRCRKSRVSASENPLQATCPVTLGKSQPLPAWGGSSVHHTRSLL